MIVVSDTSTLNYLVLVDLPHILPELFERILIPEAVREELRSTGAPESIARFLAAEPAWLETRRVSEIDAKLQHLDPGEREAIELAASSAAGLVLIDERKGRQAARARGLAVSGRVCDSVNLVVGRNTIVNGAELHQPNTIANSCADGTSGTFHVNASNDRLRVSTVDGTLFAPGKTVRIEAFVWAAGTINHLDLYYTASAATPNWTFVATVDAAGPGPQTMSATYVLPAGGVQAVRARFRSGGSQMPCTGNSSGFDDHDDLVFAVGP